MYSSNDSRRWCRAPALVVIGDVVALAPRLQPAVERVALHA
jgi:hypothetical protein